MKQKFIKPVIIFIVLLASGFGFFRYHSFHMGLFDASNRSKNAPLDSRLLGRWLLVRADQGFSTGDRTVSEFSSDGKLIYSITQGGKTGIMNMTYRVDGSVLITDQPSSPSEERTKYSFDDSGLLMLDYNNARTWFQRIQ